MASQWLILLAIVLLARVGTTSPIPFSNERNVPLLNIKNTNDNYYQNDVFGLSIEKPEGWYSMTSEELNSLFKDAAIPMVVNNNNLDEETVKTTKQSLTPLFGFMEYRFGTQHDTFNPNIIAIATNITGEAIIENDCDAYIYSNKLIQGTKQMSIVSNSDCSKVDINGKQFAMQELTLNVLNLTIINQIQYVRSTSNGYFFTFTLAFNNDVGKNQLESIMNTLHFSQQ